MTFPQLVKHFPRATKDTWHKHSNGSGWVKNTATVAKTAFVGEDAVVSGRAKIFKNVQVSENILIYGHAEVSGDAEVYGDARVEGNTKMGGKTSMSKKVNTITSGKSNSLSMKYCPSCGHKLHSGTLPAMDKPDNRSLAQASADLERFLEMRNWERQIDLKTERMACSDKLNAWIIVLVNRKLIKQAKAAVARLRELGYLPYKYWSKSPI